MTARTFPWRALPGFIAAVAALAGTALPVFGASQTDEVPPDRAVIHFVDFGGIENWRAHSDDALYIEARNHKWYKATFFGPCTGLRFANSIGFVSDSGGALDRFGSIVVRQPGKGAMECHFRSFAEIPAPPAPAKKKGPTATTE